MKFLTSFSPIRIFISGLLRISFSTPLLFVGGVIIWIVLRPAKAPPSAGDPPIWTIALISIPFLFFGVMVFAGGAGRIISAFSRNCFIAAGPPGVAVRYPVHGWFGRFSFSEYKLLWNDIRQIILYTYRINGIPSTTELRLQLRDGSTIKIDRNNFAASSKTLQAELLALKAQFARA